MKKLKKFLEENHWNSTWYSRDDNGRITSQHGSHNYWTDDYFNKLWDVLQEIYNKLK